MRTIEMPTRYAIAGGEPWETTIGPDRRDHGADHACAAGRRGNLRGLTCVDVGCGAGHVSRSLAVLMGPTGRVVGLDVDAVKLAAAAEETAPAGLRNVEFRTTNVSEWSEPGAYDLAYGASCLTFQTGSRSSGA